METIELCNKDQAQIMKGKRTKRPRLPSPLRLTMASTSSSPGRTTSTDNNNYSGGLTDMATSSIDHHQLRESTEEEEDMANCLILLAQGHTRKPSTSHNDNNSKASSGLYLYQCKTCERCFPSFQALGGHRASHKKPRSNTEGKLQAVSFANEEGERHDRYDPTTTSTTLSLQLSNGALHSSSSSKSKVHECSICGAEFSSGQALGGHMRRHRTFVNNCTTSANAGNNINGGNGSGNSEFQEAKKPRNVLKLDLNLPAPDDDHRESKLSFPSKENVLVFSASSLVDCHY